MLEPGPWLRMRLYRIAAGRKGGDQAELRTSLEVR